MPNDRSDAAMRERLKLAEKATQGPWYHTLAAIVGTKKSPEDNDATCICFTEWGCSGDPQANAAHIAASSPDVVRADIEEILRLRKERDWLLREVSRNNRMPVFCPMPDRYECLYHVGDECKSRDVEMRVGCWRTAVECAVKCVEKKENAE